MPADVDLAIVEPDAGVVVAQRWIGGNEVRAIIPVALRRAPDHAEAGDASWVYVDW